MGYRIRTDIVDPMILVILTPLFEKKGGAWAKIEVYFARYLKRRGKRILMTQSLCKGKEN